jgi:hypothetical protein
MSFGQSYDNPRIVGFFQGSMSARFADNALQSSCDASRIVLPNSHLVLQKIWSVCSEFVAEKSGTSEALQLPVQMLLLVVKWLRLSLISWDDVLRLSRRYGGSSQCALLLDRFSFLQVLEDSIQFHLALMPYNSSKNLANEKLDCFLLEQWDKSKELSSLRWFLDASFNQLFGFAPASIYTGSVLDVLVVYRERWDHLLTTLDSFGMKTTQGVVMALDCLMDVSEAAIVNDVSMLFELAPQWCAYVFDNNSDATCRDNFWEVAVLCAVSLLRQRKPLAAASATQIRSATLDLFGDTLGSLLLPQVAWKGR